MGAFIDGLLSGAARKTGWQLAEQAGLARPYRIQSLLGRSSWQADALCAPMQAEALATLGDPGGLLVVDETGFLKKGTHSVGVARQYSGTAGRVENCQVCVFLAYASRFGQALIDRRLYLPEAWAGDAARRRAAAVPEMVSFQTKPAMAADLIATALDAGTPCAFVLADALYGSDSRIRRMLEARHQPYVLATRSNHTLRLLTDTSLQQTDPLTLAEALSAKAWAPHAAGEGAKGIRLSDWARIALPWTAAAGFERWLLIRRSRRAPAERAYYLVFARAGTTLAELAGAAGLSARKSQPRPPDHGRLSYTRFHTTLTDAIGNLAGKISASPPPHQQAVLSKMHRFSRACAAASHNPRAMAASASSIARGVHLRRATQAPVDEGAIGTNGRMHELDASRHAAGTPCNRGAARSSSPRWHQTG